MHSESPEHTIRERLGVPPDARRVLIFAESSHWDPNWLMTSEEYYERRVRHTLDAMLLELLSNPRRIFSIECTFFLRMYWERFPERRDELRAFMNDGRIRLTGTSVTTPDTTLPDAEAVIRDYLVGRQWLQSIGVTQEPRVAYLPDNFGNSPALPTLLEGMGFRYVVVTRIDGMHFPGDDWRLPSEYPLKGSSAALLSQVHRSADFWWQSPDGIEMLTHWNPFTYFQGDMLASRGIIRWMERTFGWRDRSALNVNGKIDGFIKKLKPLSPTPYLFCPIGCDFNDPIPNLVELLDRYNRMRYPKSGVWVVNAAMEDYMELIATHADTLPKVTLDPNPYWMGFYASRPQLKQRIRRVSHTLAGAERVFALAHSRRGEEGSHVEQLSTVRDGWERLVTTNHHDFITGTAPDRVWQIEQISWLEDGEQHAVNAMHAAAPRAAAQEVVSTRHYPTWTKRGGELVVSTPWATLTFDEALGGCLTSWIDASTGQERIAGPSNDLIVYYDSGGLWRMGHEYRGGSLRPLDRASRHHADLHVEERGGSLRVVARARINRRAFVRTVTIRADSPELRLRVDGSLKRRRTATISFRTRLEPGHITMDVVGGVVARPFEKLYDPTFWCASNFAHLANKMDGPGLGVLLAAPAAISAGAHGRAEWVVLRNAHKERAFGFLPVLAHPAAGVNDGRHGLDCAVLFTPGGDWQANQLDRKVEDYQGSTASACSFAAHGLTHEPHLQVEPQGVRISAVKTSEDGDGVIVRLFAYEAPQESVCLSSKDLPITSAQLCDALERPLGELRVEDGRIDLPSRPGYTTIRLQTLE